MFLITGRQGATPASEQGPLLMLGSNDYLGLAGDDALVEGATAALGQYGCGLAMNQPFGSTPLQARLEEAVAAFTGAESALLFGSCTAANIAFLTALGREPGTVIHSDAGNHASIIDGCRLSQGRTITYSTRNLGSVGRHLKAEEDATRQIVISDAVFSADGAIAPARGLAQLTSLEDHFLVLDESHAAGVIGRTGRGILQASGLDSRRDLIALTGTFAKAFGAGSGGYIAGPRELLDEVRAVAGFYLFNTGMHVAAMGAALAALAILQESTERLERLRSNTQRLRDGLTATGFRLLGGDTPIVPILIGNEDSARRFAHGLATRAVGALLMTEPYVPRGEARIRLQLSALHSEDHIDLAIDRLGAAGRQAGSL